MEKPAKKNPFSLVTGGAGFLGSHLAGELLKVNHKVVIIDNLSSGHKENVPERTVFVKGSINNQPLLDNLFKNYHFTYIFHLAAYPAEHLSHNVRTYNYENNLLGSVNLINRAIIFGIKHFIFTSSIAVYGINQLPMHEELPPNPDNPYGIAKLAVEYDLKAAEKQFGLRYTIFRPHNVYGEKQNIADPERNVVGIFIKHAFENKPLPIFGSGDQTRAFTYVDDVVPYIAKSIKLPNAFNHVINIGSDRPYSINKLAQMISNEIGRPLRVEHLPERNEVEHAIESHKKAKKIFGIKETTSLEKGLSKTIQWAKQQVPKKAGIKLKLDIPGL